MTTAARLHEILKALPLGVVLLDRAGAVVLDNEAERRLTGHFGDEMLGRDFFAQLAATPETLELRRAFQAAMEDPAKGLEVDRELSLPVAGVARDVRVRMRKLELDGAPHALLLLEDNARVKESERALARALGRAQDEAVRDALTGLFNRRHIEAVLPGELKRAQRLDAPLSFLILDVDHFKAVNDRFGHPVGDRVLAELARLMHRIMRVGDTCARLGGEEFGVVLPHTDSGPAAHAAERLHRVVRAMRFEEEPELRVRVSVGIATARDLRADTDFGAATRDLFARADAALYEAKRTGRDRTVVRA